MIKSAYLALPLVLLAGACTVGPDFKRPETKTAPTYASPEDAPLPADQRLALGNSPDIDWWTRFRSPALDGTVRLALGDNQQVAAAKARMAAAQEAVKAATGALLPQLSIGANATESKYGPALFGPSSINIPPFVAYTAGPNATFPTDLFGGGRRSVEQKAALAQYQAFQLAETHLALAGNVTTQALAMATAKAQADAVQKIVASDAENIRLVETALNVGSATQTQLVAAQSQLATDRTLLPALHQQQSVARHALSILVGKAPADWSPPDFGLADFTLPQEIPATLPSELAHNRPDILAAEAQLHAASAAIGVATANLYPQLNLSAGFTVQSLALGGPFSAAWALAAGVVQPIFNGGQLSAEKRAAVDRYDEALAQYKQTVLTAFGQVADRLQALANDADQLQAQQAAARTAGRALELARRSYSLGNTGILDVIDTQRRFSQAELGLSQARAQRLLDTAQLFVALGGTPLPATTTAAAR
jgi:NodT family efflux transporter outer membrane factor (OMF) lipoprotein